MAGAIIYVAGARRLHFIVSAGLAVILVPLLLMSPLLEEYQKERIATFQQSIPDLTAEEKEWFERVEESEGPARPYWLFASGGKWDYTIKWWSADRYQQVVRHFQDRIDFVQVGESHHHHPTVEGVIDLRGRTTLRQLIRLMYHAQGAISAVSLLMHLAAAVEVKPGMPKNRPCVVIAGGREPPHFTAYPHHQFLHTVGALRCCDNGGCWKARTVPLGDGDQKDEPGQLCVDVVGGLPRCMDMIAADEVIRRVGMYFDGGAVSFLPEEEAGPAPG